MNVSAPRFIGLDLAWSARNPSGLAVVDATGNVLEATVATLDDAALLAWVRERLAGTTVIGIDMPTIVRNASGIRACERALAVDFRAAHAAPHPANLRRFPDGGRARRLLDALAADGIAEDLAMAPRAVGRFAFEVFPHPALVRLFELPSIFRYKKKTRPWPLVLAEWARYRAALGSLEDAVPPLVLPSAFPTAATQRGYKRFDDLLDGVTCAYVASYLWHHGTALPATRIYGDLVQGYIAVPVRSVREARRAGTTSV